MESFSLRRMPRRPVSTRRVVAVLAALACGWVAYAVYGAVVQGHSLDDRVRDLGTQNAALSRQIADRKREISEAQSPAWLEGEARKLDYVLPGERTFVFPSPGAVVPAGGGVDVGQLPVYPTAAPGAPAATATPAAGPTPYAFALPPPPPH